MYRVSDLFKKYAEKLSLELVSGHGNMKRKIPIPEAHRPGLSLAGFLKNRAERRILIFGKVEMSYLKSLDPELRAERLRLVVTSNTPAVIVARRLRPLKELQEVCEELGVPLMRTSRSTMKLLSDLVLLLTEEFAPSMNCHGTLVEVFGVGVLIQGESSVGKSEAALGLIERGHRLISDDVVRVRQRESTYLEGSGIDLTRHLMEIRGIGIINVAHLYGAVCVRETKCVDIVVKLEDWDDDHFYDRIGLDEKVIDILDISLPFHVLPVKPGRDVVLLLETIALNHRLKILGYHSAKDFTEKLLDVMSSKKRRGVALGNSLTAVPSVVKKVKVKNHLGLHTRPATVIVKLLRGCKCDVTFTFKRDSINAKSILSILMLAAKKNSQITITTCGEDAEEVMDKLVEAFDNEFGEFL